MSIPDVITDEPVAPVQVEAVVNAFLTLQETNLGKLAHVLTDDAVFDLNVPQWRFQVGGNVSIAAAFAESFPTGFHTTGHRWEPTPHGAVVEYDGWDIANDTYYRHLAVLETDGGRIARLTVYCTGGWDTETLERQRREAPMVDDEQAGGAR